MVLSRDLEGNVRIIEKFTLYKIYYCDNLVYLGRTKQPIATRLRGHFFKKPMHKVIDIAQVSRIEICNCKTQADMFLYEIYYINKLKPLLNCDDKSKDELTVYLPELGFEEYTPPKMTIWKEQILEIDKAYKLKKQKEAENRKKLREARNEARKALNDIT